MQVLTNALRCSVCGQATRGPSLIQRHHGPDVLQFRCSCCESELLIPLSVVASILAQTRPALIIPADVTPDAAPPTPTGEYER